MNCYRFVDFIKIALAVALLCIFGSFIRVDYWSTWEFSGVEVALGVEIDDGEIENSDILSPNIFVIASFISGIVGLGTVFGKESEDNNKFTTVTIFSVIAAICLIVFRLSFLSYIGENSKYVEVEGEWGWIISLVCYSISAIMSYYTLKLTNDPLGVGKTQIKIVQVPVQSVQQVVVPIPEEPKQSENVIDEKTTCHGCYKTISADAKLCPHCGYRMK